MIKVSILAGTVEGEPTLGVSCWISGIYHGRKNLSHYKITSFGRLKIFVDWITHKGCLQVISLENWKRKVKSIIAGFS